jgi:LPS-assembly protein
VAVTGRETPKLAWSILIAVASIALAPPQAHAKTGQVSTGAAKPAAAAPDDGLAGGGFYLEADQLTDDEASNTVIAKGGVEARYEGRVLRAAEVDYDRASGVITAHGKVSIINPDGSAEFADDITLDKSLSEGIALGFSTRLADQVKIAAATAHRSADEVTELDRVIYTPCPVCADNAGHKPTWSIRARKVVQDHNKKTLYFQDAVIQVKGIDVVYLPAFWAADPTADRKSGFLLPIVTFSGKRGLSYEQPYYQVISPSQDITVTPQLNSKVNPFLNLDWRKRFYSGVVDIRAGYTYEQDFTSGGDRFGPSTSRSYILGSGLFDLTPNLEWGFTAERASDKLIFDKYSVPDVFTDRGLYAADDRRLISQLYGVRQDSESYLSVAAVSVQGLRPGDDQSSFPTIAPLIEGRWDPRGPILGGRLRIEGSAVALTRDQSVANPGPLGVDSRRATLQANWLRTFTLANGLRVAPFVDGRVDLYSLASLPTSPTSATIAQAFGTVGVNVSYPLIKQSGAFTYVLEPLAQLALSPELKQDPRIPDEDSAVFEFDETNLFETNRSPGFDVYDGGQKLNLGGRATAFLEDGRSASVLVGRSFRAEANPGLPQRTGLQTSLSDYIVAGEITPLTNVHLFSRWRLDTNTLAVNRLEAGGEFTTSRVSGYLSYLQEAQSPTGRPVKSLDFRGEIFATRHWGLTLYGIHDVEGNVWRREDIGVVYRDACVRVEILYRHDQTFNGTLGPSTSVVLRLTLATLGNSGYSADRPPAP